jgi:hypothetical protein
MSLLRPLLPPEVVRSLVRLSVSVACLVAGAGGFFLLTSGEDAKAAPPSISETVVKPPVVEEMQGKPMSPIYPTTKYAASQLQPAVVAKASTKVASRTAAGQPLQLVSFR